VVALVGRLCFGETRFCTNLPCHRPATEDSYLLADRNALMRALDHNCILAASFWRVCKACTT
jgi:hypothetical protein